MVTFPMSHVAVRYGFTFLSPCHKTHHAALPTLPETQLALPAGFLLREQILQR